MTFKVKDLIVGVGTEINTEPSTCTGWTRTTTGGLGCLDSLLFGQANGERAGQGLSLLRSRLRQAVQRA
ncbi:MAG TPA: hypothetical protein VN493_31880 [Thermoanaerobaculia bacterium]|nr:hypothetical protein [Thermoanaerobaculia bacterium]